jgi:hypothetical protein
MKIINFTDFLKSKFTKETPKKTSLIEPRISFYERKFGGAIPNFTSFNGFIDSFAIFSTSNCDEILIDKKHLKKFAVSQARMGQNLKPLQQAIQAISAANNLK